MQVFSVRLRDRGPDYRGFVQLPLVQDLDGNPAEGVDPAVLAGTLCSLKHLVSFAIASHGPQTYGC